MKIVSFNYRGIARLDKKPGLRRLVYATPIVVIFPQETLGSAHSITHLLGSMFLGWNFIGVDANGRSGGLCLGYNKRSINLSNCWGGPDYIGDDLFSADLGIEV